MPIRIKFSAYDCVECARIRRISQFHRNFSFSFFFHCRLLWNNCERMWRKNSESNARNNQQKQEDVEEKKNDFSAPFCSNKLVAVTLFFIIRTSFGVVGITYSRYNRRKSATKCFLMCVFLSLLAEHHVGAWLLQNLNKSDCTKTRCVKMRKKNN